MSNFRLVTVTVKQVAARWVVRLDFGGGCYHEQSGRNEEDTKVARWWRCIFGLRLGISGGQVQGNSELCAPLRHFGHVD